MACSSTASTVQWRVPVQRRAPSALPVCLVASSAPRVVFPHRVALRRALPLDGCQKAAKFGTAPESVAVVAEAMSSFGNNFALIGNHPVEELDEGRHGVEIPHEVRWMPQGKRAEPMARVAVLEHAIARG